MIEDRVSAPPDDDADQHPVRAHFPAESRSEDNGAIIDIRESDVRSAIESGLRAVLELAVGSGKKAGEATGAAPIRGEGENLAALFTDMVEDLLAQIELYGEGLHEVAVDGLLRREGDGFRAWGYVSGNLRDARPTAAPVMLGHPHAIEDSAGQVRLVVKLSRP